MHWLYRHEPSLRTPYDTRLAALLHEPTQQNLLPQGVFLKARVIQKVGNQAVHSPQPIGRQDALQLVRELHHICYWLARTHARTRSPAPQGALHPGHRPLRQHCAAPDRQLFPKGQGAAHRHLGGDTVNRKS